MSDTFNPIRGVVRDIHPLAQQLSPPVSMHLNIAKAVVVVAVCAASASASLGYDRAATAWSDASVQSAGVLPRPRKVLLRDQILNRLPADEAASVREAREFFEDLDILATAKPPVVSLLESGAVLVEWSATGKKLAMFFEENSADSSWVLASKLDGVKSGSLSEMPLGDLLKQFG